MENRRNALGFMLVIVIILLAALIVLVIYTNFFKNTNNISNLNNGQTNSLNNIKENDSKNVTNEVVKTVEVAKVVTFNSKNVALKNGNFNISRNFNDAGVTHASLKYDGTVSVFIAGIQDQIKYFYPNLKAELYKKYTVTGFSNEVVDINICGYGQAATYPLITFVMKDGSVEYLNSKQAFENLNFRSSGKIQGLSNIVKVEEVFISEVNETGEGPHGYNGIVAIDNTGKVFEIDPSALIK